ncbi:hypothetical protein [Laspinema sp. D2d]|uniref:hypothetical protein n=1 Tax=Laspinema sp. D2d TaxID=2953686 RepID=UPI0021BB1307|nr:hypothetical protein [Laspinema sp. D2d]
MPRALSRHSDPSLLSQAIAGVVMTSFPHPIPRTLFPRIASVMAIAVLVSACTPTNPSVPTQWKTYQNQRFGFEFPYPPDWVALPPPTNQDGRAFHAPDYPNIEIRGWGTLKLTGLEEAEETPTVPESNFTTEQGLPAWLEVEVGTQESVMRMTLESGDVIYTWQGRSPKDRFGEYYSLFYAIAQNYRLTP